MLDLLIEVEEGGGAKIYHSHSWKSIEGLLTVLPGSELESLLDGRFESDWINDIM